jgi:hypothetical protein
MTMMTATQSRAFALHKELLAIISAEPDQAAAMMGVNLLVAAMLTHVSTDNRDLEKMIDAFDRSLRAAVPVILCEEAEGAQKQ